MCMGWNASLKWEAAASSGKRGARALLILLMIGTHADFSNVHDRIPCIHMDEFGRYGYNQVVHQQFRDR